jgi:integrase
MASIRRKVGSKFWYACFTTPDGKRAQRSTESTDRKLALKLADGFEETAQKKRTESQVRQVMSDIHERIHGSAIASATLDAYRQQWLSRKLGEVSKSTHAAYKQATQALVTFLIQKSTQPIQYVTSHDIALWRDHIAAKVSATTANNKLKIVRVLFQEAWRENLLTDNPAAKVSVLRTSPALRRPFTLVELKSVLRVSSGEWKGMILFGSYTGQRLKDIASLTWGQVDLARKELRFVTSKTGRNQVIPLHPVLTQYFEEQSSAASLAGPLFPLAYELAVTNRDVSPLSQQFHHILVRAGLALPRPTRKKSRGIGRNTPRQKNALTFHSLRHTATSWLKDAGVSESVARDIIGHESAEISRLYTHTGDTAKRDAVDRLPNLLSVPAKPKAQKYIKMGTQIVRLKAS